MIELLAQYGALGIVMAVTTTFLGGYFTEAGKSFWEVTKTHGPRWFTVFTSYFIAVNFIASMLAIALITALVWYSKKFDFNLKGGLLVVLDVSCLVTLSMGAFIFSRLYGLGRYVESLHDYLIDLEKHVDRQQQQQPVESPSENSPLQPSENQAR